MGTEKVRDSFGDEMRYNKLGSTGLFVSELCLGTMTFGGSGRSEVMGWLLAQRRVTSVVIVAKRVEQLEDNLGAVDVTFTEDDLQSLGRVSQISPEYPGWMISMWGQERATQLAGSHT